MRTKTHNLTTQRLLSSRRRTSNLLLVQRIPQRQLAARSPVQHARLVVHLEINALRQVVLDHLDILAIGSAAPGRHV